MAKNEEMYSMSYEDARNKYGTGIGNNKMFMPKETFTKKQAEYNKNKQKTKTEDKPKKPSLVADKFGDKKEKTWEDVKRENGNDPKKMAEWLNNNPSYKAGNLTKKGMDELGYAQGEDGKWAIKQPTVEDTTDTDTTDTTNTTTEPTTITTTSYTPNTEESTTESDTKPTTPTTKTTTEGVNNELESLKKKYEDLKKELEKYTDKEGKVDKDAAFESMDEYHKRMIENGSATIDKNGKFKLKPVGKGWETWATLLSAGVSAVGLAMGIPIPPINFRKLTGKNERDEHTRKVQQQYLDILSDNYAKIEDMKTDINAGKLALENQEALTAQEKHAQATGATKDVITAQTDAEKQLIEKRTNEQIKADQTKFDNDMKRMEADNNFKIKYAALMADKDKEMQKLMSDLSTGSAKELIKYQNADIIKDIKELGLSLNDVAYYYYAQQGKTATDKNFGYVNDGLKTLLSILKLGK